MSLTITPQPGPAVPKDRSANDRSPADPRPKAAAGFKELLQGGSQGAPGAAIPGMVQTRPEMFDAAWSGLEGGIEVEAASQRFNLSLAADNRAIAFDARPIVGPTSIAAFTAENQFQDVYNRAAVSDARGAVTPPRASATFDSSADLTVLLGQSVTSAANIGPRPRPALPVPLSGTSGNLTAQTNLLPVPGSPSAAGVQPGKSLQSSPAATSAPATSPFTPGTSTRAQLLAQLLASTDEYRVVVRGTALGRAEELDLAKAIRAVLRAQGLPDRPVIVSVVDGRS